MTVAHIWLLWHLWSLYYEGAESIHINQLTSAICWACMICAKQNISNYGMVELRHNVFLPRWSNLVYILMMLKEWHFGPFFIRPSSDGTYYGMVMSVRPGLRPSVHPSVRPSQFSALFSYMLWHIDLKFCVSLYFYARKIKFKCHQFPSLFTGVMLLFIFKLLQICSFPHFSPTCFAILSSNFVYDFVLMYHRASLSVVILLQFFLSYAPFGT